MQPNTLERIRKALPKRRRLGPQRVFMKRPERGLQAASCVIAVKSREISWQPCDADAEAA
jgi:hypothetical protein